jgi:hypothetical protein
MPIPESSFHLYDRKSRIVYLQVLIAVALWMYIIYRAFMLSITQDEAYSYLLAKTDYWKAMPGSANTHWLNTLSMRLFLFLPGPDEPWKLRMLSLLSWPLYAFSVARLSGLFANRWIGMAFFLTMLVNPFLLFFFSLGRGYAAACACISFCLWLASKRFTHGKTGAREWRPVFVWACLAALCNFTALYFLLGLCITFAFILYRQHQLNWVLQKEARPLVHIVIATICFSIASLLFIDLYSGDLEHGGQSDLAGSLFGSLLVKSIHIKLPAVFKTVASLFISGALLISGIYAWYSSWKTKSFDVRHFCICVMLLIGLLNAGFHFFLGIPYLLDRTTLIIFPLLTLCLYLFIELLFKKWAIAMVSALIMMLTGLNFVKSFSLNYFKEWPVQEHSVKAYDFLEQQRPQNVAMDVWQYSVLHNYYRYAYPGRYKFRYTLVNYRQLSDTTGTSLKNFDYLLLSSATIRKENTGPVWNVEMKDSVTGLTLFERRVQRPLPKEINGSPK